MEYDVMQAEYSGVFECHRYFRGRKAIFVLLCSQKCPIGSYSKADESTQHHILFP